MASYLRRGLKAIGITLLFLILCILLFSFIDLRRHPAHSRYNYSWGASKTAPGIGFQLTPGYGTAAVRHHNGSVVDVGKIDAQPAYKQMMQRLSEKDTSITGVPGYPCYPYTWAAIGNIYRWANFRRSFRKRIGLPATEDVALLAEMLAALRQQTERYLGHSVDWAVASFPHHQSLCREDITDALEYVDIFPLWSRQLWDQPRDTSAAYAGHGFGLCEDYLDADRCMVEEKNMSSKHSLFVAYTHDALVVRPHSFQSAYDSGYGAYESFLVDYDLGLSSLPKYPDSTEYWDQMRAILRKGALGPLGRITNDFDQVILFGEDADFLAEQPVVRDVLGDLQDQIPEILDADGLYVAARGAAEFAKRAQEWRARKRDEEEGAGSLEDL